MKKKLICLMMSMAMAVVVATPAMAAESLKGDVNANGIVDQADLDALKAYLLDDDASKINLDNADVNSDGTVDLLDYVDLQHAIAAGVKGDVNGDKYVDDADLAALKAYLLDDDASKINLDNADVNSDGTVDLLDYVTLQHML